MFDDVMRVATVLTICLALQGCGLPRDPSGTLRRVQGGVVRVGIVDNPPWVIAAAGEPAGVEPAIVKALAAELGAQVQWTRASEHDLMRGLHTRGLDLAIGGFDAKLPWVEEAALTRPYYRDDRQHVFAVPPGENAWMVRVETVLHAHEADVGRLIAEAARR
jgi:polar amino acid transport system substrate-binding protein